MNLLKCPVSGIALLWLIYGTAEVVADEPPRLVMLLDTESGEYRAVAPDTEYVRQGSPVFSPDGTLVAFDARRDGESFRETRILVKSLVEPEQPPEDLGSGAMPSYSKNGREIAFSLPRVGGVWIMGAQGDSEFQLRSDAWHIVFSPIDNNIVAYGVRGEPGPNIVIHRLDNDETRNVLPPEVSQEYRQIRWNFQWSPDGRWIVFKGVRTDGEQVLALVETTANAPRHRILKTAPHHDRSWIHPGTGRLFFSSSAGQKDGPRIFELDPAQQDAKLTPQLLRSQPPGLLNDVGAWSTDGRQLLIVSVAPEVAEPLPERPQLQEESPSDRF